MSSIEKALRRQRKYTLGYILILIFYLVSTFTVIDNNIFVVFIIGIFAGRVLRAVSARIGAEIIIRRNYENDDEVASI